jgi:CubicO group peptidase (beta-lactamase class C family)
MPEDLLKLAHSLIDHYLTATIAADKFPGAAYLIADAQGIRALGACGRAVVQPLPLDATVDTLFDIASLTKPLVVGTLLGLLYQQEKLDFQTPVSYFLPEFNRSDKRSISVAQLATHSSGMRDWLPLYCLTGDAAAVLSLIARYPLVAAPNSRVIYSDLNYIVLGQLLERLLGNQLDVLFQELVIKPLKIKSLGYCPALKYHLEVAATETGSCYQAKVTRRNLVEILQELTADSWKIAIDAEINSPTGVAEARKTTTNTPPAIVDDPKMLSEMIINSLAVSGNQTAEKTIKIRPNALVEHHELIWGTVHDQNARFLGGVSGHAGLFGNIHSVYQLARQFLNDSELFTSKTLAYLTQDWTPHLLEGRGIGWQLNRTTRLVDGVASSQPADGAGAALPANSFGHLGFTGTSLWLDPSRQRSYILLTNCLHPTYRGFTINPYRREFHQLAQQVFK